MAAYLPLEGWGEDHLHGIMVFTSQWHAIGREGELAAEQLATGVTILGRADHAQKGLYSQAFFALSIGLERLAKLIVVADYAITHGGRYPTNRELRDFGHDIAALLDRCQEISARHRTGKVYADRPTGVIHTGIIAGLSEFGVISRYYNLDFLAGTVATYPEPIHAWWSRVAMPILAQHYSAAQRDKDAAWATASAVLIGPAFVLHYAEDGTPIDDVTALTQRAMATRVVQKYGRLYTLQIIRWLAFLISDLADLAAGRHDVDAFFGLGEAFTIFMNDDKYLKSRTRFTIYAG
jgi:hypothetical protein